LVIDTINLSFNWERKKEKWLGCTLYKNEAKGEESGIYIAT
jgi:hypothetical protein